MTRALVALAVVATSAHADSLGATSYRLANGLEVILAPDASVGTVVVHVRYRAGTADDPYLKEGLARLVSRVDGSTHVEPDAQARAVDETGGWNTSSINADHVGYTTHVPSNALALALYFEADRMAGFRDAVTDQIVDKHRREIARDDFSSWRPKLDRAMWSDDHRGFDVHDSIDKLTAGDVKSWWSRYGTPGDATLVVAGAFDPSEARRLVERYFAWIPDRAAPARSRAEVVPLHELVETGGTGRRAALVIAFRAPAPGTTPTADLDVASRILAGGKASRLYRRLVVADRVATDVSTTFECATRGCELVIEIAVIDENASWAARTAVFDELAKFRSKGVTTDELVRAKAAILHDETVVLETLWFRAQRLAAWSAYGDDFPRWRARIDGVLTSSVQGTAAKWLVENAAVVMVIGGRLR